MAYGSGTNGLVIDRLPSSGGDDVYLALAKIQSQLNDLYGALNIDIVRATKADVDVATDPAKFVTPLAIAKNKAGGVAGLDATGKISTAAIYAASEVLLGISKIATQAIVDAGVNDTDFVTAKKLAKGQAGGVAPLGSDAKIPAVHLPADVTVYRTYKGNGTDAQVKALIIPGDLYIRG